jgi:hypothetical protein
MAFPSVLTKKMTAGVSNGIALSQSVSANTAMVLNGSLTNRLSTTTTAAVAAGGVVLPLASVTGVVVGQLVTDTTATTLVTGTYVAAVGASGVTIWPPVGGTTVGNGDTIVFPGTATLDATTATNSAIGRRVVVAYTGTDCNWTVVGTNSTNNAITDTIVGASGAGQSNLDFVTVTSLTPAGSVTAATAGTNGVGSTPWIMPNWHTNPINDSFAVEVVSGSVNFTVQYTYDDPNNLLGGAAYPLAFNDPVVNAVAVTSDGVYAMPVAAIRFLINSGTGQIRARILQSGIG